MHDAAAASGAIDAGREKAGVLVRGEESAHVHMEPYPARLLPRWDQVGYRSVFAAQTAASRDAQADSAAARRMG
jgi:hypothetical protein